jgi:hypothetical protein
MSKQDEKRIMREMDAIDAKLKKHGFKLYGYDPGVTFVKIGDPDSRVYSFSGPEWKFVEGLLDRIEELEG